MPDPLSRLDVGGICHQVMGEARQTMVVAGADSHLHPRCLWRVCYRDGVTDMAAIPHGNWFRVPNDPLWLSAGSPAPRSRRMSPSPMLQNRA